MLLSFLKLIVIQGILIGAAGLPLHKANRFHNNWEWFYNNTITNKGLLSLGGFWLFGARACLFIAGAMASLHSRRRGFVCLYFDAMTPMLMMAHSKSHDVLGDNIPLIPVCYYIHADEVLTGYASDKNQAIHRMISC